MCSCKAHHDLNQPCTCVCIHPGDGRLTVWRKQALWRIRPLKHDAQVKYDNALATIAMHLPRDLVYWTVIVAAVEGHPDYPAEQTVNDVLRKIRS